VSGIALLALGVTLLAPAATARAQGDGTRESGLDQKRKALLTELRAIEQTLRDRQADLDALRSKVKALNKQQAEQERVVADLKKRAARIADALKQLDEDAFSPFALAMPRPKLNPPYFIGKPPSPKPCPPSPRPWPRPWPPPDIDPNCVGINVIPFGTQVRPTVSQQTLLPTPATLRQR
jgi:hypothetical protein